VGGALECADPQLTGAVIPSAARDLGRMRSDRCPLYVYILSSQSRVLYTGSTNDLHRRMYQHKAGLFPGFTQEYHVTRLVYFECHASTRAGVERERKVKGWRRAKKLALIETINAGCLDLAADWFPDLSGQGPSLRSG
jgi:putative endonuclease